MTAAQWQGEPDVREIEHGIEIRQSIIVSGLTFEDGIQIVRFEDGDIRITSLVSERHFTEFEIPVQWLPYVNEFMVRAEVSAA